MTSKKDDLDIEALIIDIAQSKKYRKPGICEDTIRDLLITELKRHPKRGDALKTARKKLHQVVAPYLGDPNYTQAITELDTAFDINDPGAIKETCAHIMQAHSTTKERLPVLDNFYHRIFAVTGQPDSILDLACGLNPLAFPWIDLPTSTQYYAYDIHQKRVDFLNHFFTLQGLPPLAKQQDILVKFPDEEADVALILKEAHRFERRQRGCTLPLLDALRVRYLVVSFPTRSLSGRRNLADHYRELFQNLLQNRPWPLTEIKFETELVFCVDKS